MFIEYDYSVCISSIVKRNGWTVDSTKNKLTQRHHR